MSGMNGDGADFLVALAARRREARARGTTGDAAGDATDGAERDVRPFVAGLLAGSGIIAEIKRRSPSRGDLHPGLDPAALARAYESGGAAALSVLTEREHFGGSVADLVAARRATSLPVLRKDFLVDEAEVVESREAGADAVLLITAILDDAELRAMIARATLLGMAALVEVHDESQLARALGAGATLVGVNQRNLRTLAVDRGRGERMLPSIPPGCVAVIESGLGDAAELARLRARGARGFLIGESLVTSRQPAARLAEFAAAVREAAGKERA